MENTKLLFIVASLLMVAITLLFSTGFGFASGYPYTIVAVGDWDCNADTEKTVANIQNQNPDIVLSLGDMSYTSKADCWLDEIAPIKDKMLIVQGNHDDNFDDYMSAFEMTGESWYSKEVTEANALFVGLNTEESLKEGSSQLEFAEKALTDTDAAWKIVFLHKPSITYGHHSSDESSPDTLLPLYDKTKTSIEFSGHNHFMQEIYPTTAGPTKVAAGEGTVHIVSGGGGRDLYDFESNEVVAQSVAEHGIVKTVLLDDKTANSEFISNEGTVTELSDIINRNSVDEPPQPPFCQPSEHIENGVCVPDLVIPTPTNTSQILITSNIQKTEATGQYDNEDYKTTYNVRNLFDNLTNTWSFWSQYGKSGFKVDLETPLNNPLCSIEVDAYNPQNQAFNMQASDSNNNKVLDFNDTIKTAKTIVEIEGCVPAGVDKLGMQFDTPEKWVTLSEVKLFTNSSTVTPPVEPPQCPPGWHYDIALQKCIEDIIEPPEPEPCPPGMYYNPVLEMCVEVEPEPPITPVVNGTISIVNSSAVIKALNTNFTIVFYDNDTSTEWESNETELNETQMNNSPIQFSSKGGE